jgi:hypothetical protein
MLLINGIIIETTCTYMLQQPQQNPFLETIYQCLYEPDDTILIISRRVREVKVTFGYEIENVVLRVALSITGIVRTTARAGKVDP